MEPNKISDLMNYEEQGSNSNNYGTSQISSSPNSFPNIMENGFIIEYKMLDYSSTIIQEDNKLKNNNPIHKAGSEIF